MYREGERKVVTTDLHSRCTSSHTGTSASSPMAAAIIALVLEVSHTAQPLHLVPQRHLSLLTHGRRHHRPCTWGQSQCTASHTGTSASSPMAATIIALVLEVSHTVQPLHLLPHWHLSLLTHVFRHHHPCTWGQSHYTAGAPYILQIQSWRSFTMFTP